MWNFYLFCPTVTIKIQERFQIVAMFVIMMPIHKFEILYI